MNIILRWCLETFRYYVFFKTSIFYILRLVFSYKLVEKTFLNILITRLNDAWGEDHYDLRRSVTVVNVMEGTTAVLVPLFAYAADVSHNGRFKMVVFSSTICITGLLLNFVAASDDELLSFGLFYPGLGLLALAQAAQAVNLEGFLYDQLRPTDLDEDERGRKTRFWWTLVSFVAGIFAQFGPLPRLDFKPLIEVLVFVMGVFFFVFLLPAKRYNFVARIENPFKDVGIVIHRAISNINVESPQPQEPLIPCLRWLDKAADEGGCSGEQVGGVKHFLKMFPLWCCFLTLSLVSASGSTFFFEETISLAGDHLDAILLFSNLSRFTEFAALEASSYVIRKLRERNRFNQQKMELVRIGIGTTCCLLCCVTASVTATRRQHAMADNVTMSAYWLTPQYILIGLMAALCENGFGSFYESQVSESLSTYGGPFVGLADGFGKFMSILCILIFSRRPFRWFQKDLEDSSLNNYYIFLAILSVVNVVIYCLVGRWYGNDIFLVEDEELVRQEVILSSSSIEGQPADAPTQHGRTQQ